VARISAAKVFEFVDRQLPAVARVVAGCDGILVVARIGQRRTGC
jgi:hypothetical protein